MNREAKITQKIIDAIENGKTSHKMPWFSMSAPVNGVSAKPYQGINILILAITGVDMEYRSNEWATYKTWQSVGRQVQKGEKSTDITFFDFFIPKEQKNLPEDQQQKRGYRKFHGVFNKDQLVQLDDEKDTFEISSQYEPPPHDNYFGDLMFGVAENSGAKVVGIGESALFSHSKDCIYMPERSLFVGNGIRTPDESYAAILAHELIHWTGHKSRLNRPRGHTKLCPEYAFEELVAELGSAFVCSELNFAYDGVDDYAGYIDSWLKILRDDPNAIFKASSQANKAKRFLMPDDGNTE